MNRIKQLRERKGLNQEALGKLLGIQQSAVSKYELGKVPLTDEIILRLTEIFHVSADYILGKEPILPADRQKVYEEILKLDSDSIQKVLDYAEDLISRRNS